jgi:mRNA interferase MazF
VKGYPFELKLPPETTTVGAVLVDQLRSLDWRARKARFIERAPTAVIDDILSRLATLVS